MRPPHAAVRKNGIPHIVSDYRDMPADPANDAVEIITPHHFHAEMTVAALEAGKHVSEQKPMAKAKELLDSGAIGDPISIRLKTIQASLDGDGFAANGFDATAESNIRKMSRLQLLVEIIHRLYRVLSEEDKRRYESLFCSYVQEDSLHYCYRVTRDEVTGRLQQIGIDLAEMVKIFEPACAHEQAYRDAK